METTQTDHPLQQTFARITAFNQYIKPQFGTPTAAGWIVPATCLGPASAAMAAMVTMAQTRLRTTAVNTVGGAIVQAYQWPLISVAIASYLVTQRVPDLALENVQVLLNAEGEAEEIAFVGGRFFVLPADPDANHPDATVVADLAALRDTLRIGIETHMGLVIEQLHQQIGCSKRGLWLFVADRCVSTLTWLLQEQNEAIGLAAIDQEVTLLVRAPGSPLHSKKVGLFELTYKEHSYTYLDRATCCYWYKTEKGEGDYCTTCPHRTKEDRNTLLLNYMAEEYAKKAAA